MEAYKTNHELFERLKKSIEFHINRDPNLDEILISFPTKITDKKHKNILKLNVSLDDV